MKLTGAIVCLVGLVILLFTGIMAMQASSNVNVGASAQAERDRLWPMIIGVSGVIVGGLLLAFGGKGYFRSESLAVRN